MTRPLSPLAGPAAPLAKADPAELKQLKHVAKQFEAVFLRQLIGTMRSAGMGDGLFDSSSTEQFRDMADARTADSMADKGVLGVADLLVRQFGARLSDAAKGTETK
ncbi:rod-binding protein [Sphingomonas sp.]|uniref:rod-binding protein n=1 Tax=Sphingomonas sp. TaxID=28214 RepID=UPI003B3B9BFC